MTLFSDSRLSRSASAIAVLLCSACVQAQAGGFKGTFLDPTGASFVGVSVSLYSDERVIQTTTDSEGRFQFDNVAPGDYEIEAKSPGAETVTLGPFHVSEGEAVKNLPPSTMNLDRETVCTDEPPVVYETLAPDSASVVGVIQPGPRKAEPNVDWRTQIPPNSAAAIEVVSATDRTTAATLHPSEDGQFRVSGLKVGKYFLRVKMSGYWEAQSFPFRVMRENTARVVLPVIALDNPIVCE
jgi:hypothetical protein